jgi:hypothetical protein
MGKPVKPEAGPGAGLSRRSFFGIRASDAAERGVARGREPLAGTWEGGRGGPPLRSGGQKGI